jgi:hypothetical protein
MIIIYDIETLRNCSIFCFKQYNTDNKKQFIIHKDKNDSEEFYNFLKIINKNNCEVVGYNNLFFDAQILEFFYKNYREINSLDIYNEAQRIISLQDSEQKFLNIIPEWKMNFNQIDLFKILHYDSPAKSTSLKYLEFSFNFPNIQQMPIHHNEEISLDQALNIVTPYCWNDVEITEKVFEHFKDTVESRIEISKEFNVNVKNASEPRIVKTVFISELSKSLNVDKKELIQRNEDFKKNVGLFKINLPEITFDDITFKNVYKKFSEVVVDPFNTKNALDFNYNWNGIQIYHGLGGLHASLDSGIYTENDEYEIRDIDATSFYPFIKMTLNIYPPYLSDKYLELLKSFFNKRKSYPKGHSLNTGYKLMINGSYGLLNEYNSPIYYPQGAIQTTVTGQLYLLYLLDLLQNKVSDFSVIQCNTDGITVRYKRYEKHLVDECMKEWEVFTKISLEDVYYKSIIVENVNNYIAIDVKNKVKHKGLFAIDLEKHKNSSFMIIPKALSKFFVNNVRVEKTINESQNIYDFCGVVKGKSNFKVNLYGVKNGEVFKETQQRITRYYISKNSTRLIKDFNDGRQVSIHSSNGVSILNLIDDNINFDDLDKNFYIKECYKIINNIIKVQHSLFD